MDMLRYGTNKKNYFNIFKLTIKFRVFKISRKLPIRDPLNTGESIVHFFLIFIENCFFANELEIASASRCI